MKDHDECPRITYLEVSFCIKEKILWLDVAMCDALTMKVSDTTKNLPEAALHLARTHAPRIEQRNIRVSSWHETTGIRKGKRNCVRQKIDQDTLCHVFGNEMWLVVWESGSSQGAGFSQEHRTEGQLNNNSNHMKTYPFLIAA